MWYYRYRNKCTKPLHLHIPKSPNMTMGPRLTAASARAWEWYGLRGIFLSCVTCISLAVLRAPAKMCFWFDLLEIYFLSGKPRKHQTG